MLKYKLAVTAISDLKNVLMGMWMQNLKFF